MSIHHKNIKGFLEEFVVSSEQRVCVLKGVWGVGKTYFWKAFFENKDIKNELKISENTSDIIQNSFHNYSYVSLFGIENLSELKSSIFKNSVPIKESPSIWKGAISREKAFICFLLIALIYLIFSTTLKVNFCFGIVFFLIAYWSETLFDMHFWKNIFYNHTYKNLFTVRFWSFKYAGKFLDHVNKLGIVKRYLGDATNYIEHAYIKDMVICFDDLERMNEKLSIAALMGYIDELAQQSNCKIIIIFNEASLEGDQRDIFNIYREKIVDREIKFSPTQQDLIRFVFKEQIERYPIIVTVLDDGHGISIRNIRILQKIKNIIQAIEQLQIEDLPKALIDDFIKYVVFYIHCYYEKGVQEIELISINDLVMREYLGNLNSEYDRHLSEDEAALVGKLEALSIRSEYILSKYIITYIIDGYWDVDSVKQQIYYYIDNENIYTRKQTIRDDLNKVWELYHNTMQDNLNNIICISNKILQNEYVYQYYDVIDFMEILGEIYIFESLSDQYDFMKFQICIDKYVESNLEKVVDEVTENSFHINSALSRRHIPHKLSEYFFHKMKSIQKTQINPFNIEYLASEFLGTNRLCTEEELEYLSNLPSEDYYQWIIDKDWDKDLGDKLKKLLNCNSSDVLPPLKKALIQIGKSSKLNAHRIKKFKIDIDDEIQ